MEIKVESRIVGVTWGRSGNTASVRGEILMNSFPIFTADMPIWNLTSFDFKNLDEKEWTERLISEYGRFIKALRPNG